MAGKRYTVHPGNPGRWLVYDSQAGRFCEIWSRRRWAKRSARELNRAGSRMARR